MKPILSASFPTILAVDGMGGDKAPDAVVAGLALAAEQDAGVSFLLYGEQERLQPLVDRYPILSQRVLIHHTDEWIAAEDKPSLAIRSLKRASMRLAIEAVATGAAHGVISAGNTGAYLALSKVILKTLPGILRPAIASRIPTARGESIMLDLGANVACTVRHLCDFSLMGEVFARHVLDLSEPRVGVLNVGSELGKGPSYLGEVLDTLRARGSHVHGFIEGDDIFAGAVDVVVTDGFTGNLVLKTAEGVSRLMADKTKSFFQHSFLTRFAGFFAAPILSRLKQDMNPKKYNGAVWLGVNGIAIKSHGSSDGESFFHAIQTSVAMASSSLLQALKKDLQG